MVVAVILNHRLVASISFHNFLHGFRAGCVTGTATLKAKLLQQLADMREEVLYLIFMDMYNSYDPLYKYILLEILEGYGVGPQARRILWVYWDRLQMVVHSGG